MGVIAPIDFSWKQGYKGKLHPSTENPYSLIGILHPSIQIPDDALDWWWISHLNIQFGEGAAHIVCELSWLFIKLQEILKIVLLFHAKIFSLSIKIQIVVSISAQGQLWIPFLKFPHTKWWCTLIANCYEFSNNG